jgi:hypothetical protein
MFCDRCGTNLQGVPAFCPTCGKPIGGVPLMPVKSRIAGHIRLLGIFWIAISAYRLLPGLFLFSAFRNGDAWFLPAEVPFFVHGIIRTVGTLFLAGGLLGIVTGWGLLDRQPWARMLAIVLGCFSLVEMPLGTALGIYTLWVLLPAQSEQEYRQISKVA